MKVFIVATYDSEYDTRDYEGVFSTRERAEQFIKEEFPWFKSSDIEESILEEEVK